MEQLSIPRNLINDQRLVQNTRFLYAFFTDAEANGTHFTYAEIDKQSSLSQSTIRKYARNYWSWFLRKEPKQGRSATFSCQGLRGYPELYFVLAHQRNQVQNYRHFSEALLKAEERAQARRARLQGTSTPLPPSPDVPGQQRPESLHIEDLPPDEEIVEEDELETGQPQDLEEETEQAIPEDESETVPGTEVSHKERMNTMAIWPFGRNKQEEQLEQFRKEIMRELENMRSSIVEQVRVELNSNTQALGQTLTGEIQGLPIPLGEPTFTRVIQVLEQSLATKQDQTGNEWASRMQALESVLREKTQQLQILTTLSLLPEGLEQLRGQVQEILPSISGQVNPVLVQTSELAAKLSPLSPLLGSVEQLQAKIDGLLSQFAQESYLLSTLQEVQEQVGGLVKLSSQSSSVPSTLEQIRTKVDNILVQFDQLSAAWAVSERLGVELLPVPSGEQRPDDLIKGYIQNTIEVIHALEQKLTIWLDQHYQNLRENRKASSKSLKHDLSSSLESMRTIIEDLVEKHSQTELDSLPQEQVLPETLSSGEQDTPPINQPSETSADRPNESDTGNDTTGEE